MLVSLRIHLVACGAGDFPGGGGLLTHAVALDLLRRGDPRVSQAVHDGLHLVTTSGVLCEGAQPAGHVRVSAGDRCLIRITAAGDSAAGALLQGVHDSAGALRIGRTVFEVGEVEFDELEGGNPTGFNELLALAGRKDPFVPLRMRFASPTTFTRGSVRVAVPSPELVFGMVGSIGSGTGLAGRWAKAGGPAVLDGFKGASLGVRVLELRSGTARVRHDSPSTDTFMGVCEFTSPKPSDVLPMWALGLFAQYAGVGWKTAMGMGQVTLRGPA